MKGLGRCAWRSKTTSNDFKEPALLPPFLPRQMQRHGREGVKEKRSDFIQGMEYETVSPNDDGATKWAHGEDVVDLCREEIMLYS